jgi:hypothetical protein
MALAAAEARAGQEAAGLTFVIAAEATDIGMSSAVAPRHLIQRRPSHFFNGRPRQANVGEQPVIEFEKLPVLVPSFQPHCDSGQPRKRDLPGPSKVRK